MRLVFLLLLALQLAAAGHFHGATLSWETVAENTVKFKLISAWSTTYQPYVEQAYNGNTIAVGDVIQVLGLEDPVLDFGDGTSPAIVKATVISVDSARHIWRGVFEVDHTYAQSRAAGGAPHQAEFSGCCRSMGSGVGWNVTTTVDTSKMMRPYSPRFALLEQQIIRSNRNESFYVPAYDGGKHPDLDGMDRPWSWQIVSENPMFTINNQTGMVSGIVDAGMQTMTVKVTDMSDSKGVYAMIDFEIDVKMYNATGMPNFVDHPATLPAKPSNKVLYTGFLFQYTFRLELDGVNDASMQINMQASELPMGASLDMVASYTASNPGYEAAFSWTTSQHDMGWKVICFQGFSNASEPVGSRQYCVDFNIELDTPPSLHVELPSPLMGLQPLQWYMGQQLSVVLNAMDRKASSSGITITNTSMLPTGSSMSETISGVDFAGLNATRTFTWEPQPRSGGSSGTFCFKSNDEGAFPNGAGHQVCYEYRVPKCMYRVRAGEMLVDIAERFGTSWLQLWALNKKVIQRPEGHGMEGGIFEGFELHIGQLVLVKEGDTLERIAARFGTTLRQIINLNADLSPAQPLMVGQLVCLVPSSCMERA
mmetsp:Transcript_5021/g.8076  ORF Transcript_5021/g.8076 Transcript_5021/m.8076 type:complete len:594 (+) Transcript_5021:36-1817(+)|eukprot:CAMPEP_0184303518 /NCGR_PEP_ID=MMETSP1049-20130417/13254_1 /TAXON_ID=77928 /ORGANISM="Proteomonas sulcata, Strain CCMP704" /LENGTH=593 /DNA_ID=CAMNT_0026615093 /DNA_START=1 /DNA_END=1782 /DNA_ORIENTATION=+